MNDDSQIKSDANIPIESVIGIELYRSSNIPRISQNLCLFIFFFFLLVPYYILWLCRRHTFKVCNPSSVNSNKVKAEVSRLRGPGFNTPFEETIFHAPLMWMEWNKRDNGTCHCCMWCNPSNGRIWTWKIVHFLNPASQFKIK